MSFKNILKIKSQTCDQQCIYCKTECFVYVTEGIQWILDVLDCLSPNLLWNVDVV